MFGNTPEAPAGIEILPIAREWPETGAPLRKLARLGAAYQLRRILRERPPDLVHAHFISSAGLIAALAGARPLAVTVHGSDLLGSFPRLRKRVARFVARRADLLNPVSPALEKALLGAGAPSDQVLQAGPGIEVARIPFAAPREVRSTPYLLCTRHLENVYDPQTLVAAVALLQAAGTSVRLTLAARGSLEPELRRLCRQLHVEAQVHFLGGFRSEDLPSLLRAHDVYVSASLRDGTSLSLLEAMAGGLYPIVSRIPANEAWIDEGQNGRLFEVREPRSLAAAIGRALADSKRLDVAERNRQRVETEACRDINLRRVEQRLRQLADYGSG